MKTSLKVASKLLLAILWVQQFVFAQTVEIHQIDVGPGDATLIKVTNTNGQINILLDAGPRAACYDMLQYLSDVNGGNLGATPYLDYVISSHYHEDHIGGFVGGKKRSRSGCFTYYGVLGDSTRVVVFAVLDKGTANPFPASIVYGDYQILAGNRRKRAGTLGGGNNTITPPAHAVPAPMPGANQVLNLGGYIDLGTDANNVPIRLRLWASDAYLYAPGTAPYYWNLADSNGVNRNNPGGYSNPNNWGLVWVLEYGKFRYFTGGDIGGEYTGSYIDIETPLIRQFSINYTSPAAARGHMCAFKADHHGSEHSTNSDFLDTLRSTIGVISSGDRHDHPKQAVLARIEAANWNKAGLGRRFSDYYMTELYPPRDVNTSRALTSGNVYYVVSDTKVLPPLADDSTQMTNNAWLYKVDKAVGGNVHGDMKILVYADDGQGHTIDQRSVFTIRWKNYNGGAWTNGWRYNCHD